MKTIYEQEGASRPQADSSVTQEPLRPGTASWLRTPLSGNPPSGSETRHCLRSGRTRSTGTPPAGLFMDQSLTIITFWEVCS